MTRMTGANDMIIAHELLHTVGASDKYDLASGAPLYPDRLRRPATSSRSYPQERDRDHGRAAPGVGQRVGNADAASAT